MPPALQNVKGLHYARGCGSWNLEEERFSTAFCEPDWRYSRRPCLHDAKKKARRQVYISRQRLITMSSAKSGSGRTSHEDPSADLSICQKSGPEAVALVRVPSLGAAGIEKGRCVYAQAPSGVCIF